MDHCGGWNLEPSRFALNTVNPIRSIVDVMKLTPNPNKELIKLTIGDPTLCSNLEAAAECKAAITHTVIMGRHDGYPMSIGYKESREAVAKYASTAEAPVTAEDVILTSGTSHALELIFSLLANPGQNILIPRPGFSLYKCLACSLGIVTKYYDLLPEKQWDVDLASLESQIDENTVAVVFNSPSNPCGAVFTRDHMQQLVEVCHKHRLPIISDEVYEHVVFQGKRHIPFADVSHTVPVFAVSAISKRFCLPGWRLGWVVIHNRNNVVSTEMKSALVSLTQRILGPCSLVQGALPAILSGTPPSFFRACNQLYEDNACAACELLGKVKGLTVIQPSGAMYMMVKIELESFPEFHSDIDFTERLVLEESVFCLPASCFAAPGFFRIVLCVPTDKMMEACERIQVFCEHHYLQSNPSVLDADGNLIGNMDQKTIHRVSSDYRIGR